jgi:hypothetical protein
MKKRNEGKEFKKERKKERKTPRIKSRKKIDRLNLRSGARKKEEKSESV